MKYLSVEYLKISKSLEFKLSFLFIVAMAVAINVGFKVGDSQAVSNIDAVFITLGNFNRYIMIHFVMILMTSLVVASEFNQGTFRYVMLRPVTIKSFIANKYMALWLFAGKVLIITSLIGLVLGTVFYGTGVLHGEGGATLNQPFLRFVVFYIGTWINTFCIISLTTYISIILKNNINTIVFTFSVLFVVLFLSRFVSDSILDFTPINYITLKPYIYNTAIEWGRIGMGIVVTMLYSSLFTALSLNKLSREDVA